MTDGDPDESVDPIIGGNDLGSGRTSGNDGDGDDDDGSAAPMDMMSIVKDTLGPMVDGLIGQNLRPILRGADIALGTVFRLVARAYDEDASRTQDILTSDASAVSKVAKLNDLLLDGEGDDTDG